MFTFVLGSKQGFLKNKAQLAISVKYINIFPAITTQ